MSYTCHTHTHRFIYSFLAFDMPALLFHWSRFMWNVLLCSVTMLRTPHALACAYINAPLHISVHLSVMAASPRGVLYIIIYNYIYINPLAWENIKWCSLKFVINPKPWCNPRCDWVWPSTSQSSCMRCWRTVHAIQGSWWSVPGIPPTLYIYTYFMFSHTYTHAYIYTHTYIYIDGYRVL
jgi:hypothetical protein